MSERCPECGAAWRAGETCEGDFFQMLAWENEHAGLGVVHHLTVLAFHLQHPSRYSPEGLAEARRLLDEFVGRGGSPQAVRRRGQASVDSGRRTWKVTARPGAAGSYGREMAWTLRAPDVVAGGPEHYVENVRAWAQGIWEVLRAP